MAAFLAATVVALLAVGFVVQVALRERLTESLDDVLEDRATATALLMVDNRAVRPGLTEGLDDPGESFTQVIGPDGSLRLSSPGLPLKPIITSGRELRAAAEGLDVRLEGVTLDRGAEDGEEIDVEALEESGVEPFETDDARVRAARVTLPDGTYTVITGATFEDRDEALRELTIVLWLGAPLALLLIGFAGFAAVGRALRPLHSALARERQLVADVSHELRTPLAVISGELELGLAASERAEAEDSMRVAYDEARRLGRLGEDLLLLARSDAARLELRREPIDASELLESTQRRFASKGPIHVEAEDDLTISADRARLEQALGNLVDNAFAYGNGHVMLRARATAGGNTALAVTDDGPGFPPDLLPHAFERFARGGEGRTGLGLAIVDVVAKAHGGTVEASNAAGGGAKIEMVLPSS
jgi:signal transduction histidine kinase